MSPQRPVPPRPPVDREAPTDRIGVVRPATKRLPVIRQAPLGAATGALGRLQTPGAAPTPTRGLREPHGPVDAVADDLHGADLLATVPRFTPRPSGWVDPLTDQQRRAATLLHAHLLQARSHRQGVEVLATSLHRVGAWRLGAPGDPEPGALIAALAPALAQARAWWASLPEPGPCHWCGTRDLCESHKSEVLAVRDEVDRIAVRIVDEVPAAARRRRRTT